MNKQSGVERAQRSEGVQTKILFDDARNALFAYGTTVPTDAAAGYATGCVFIKTNGGVGTAVYLNEGSSSSSNFNESPTLTGGAITFTQAVTMSGGMTVSGNSTTDTSTAARSGAQSFDDMIETEFDPSTRSYVRASFTGKRVGLVARISDWSLYNSVASYDLDWVMSGSATAFGGAGDSDGGAVISASNSSSFAFIKPSPGSRFSKLKLSTSKSPRFRAIIKTGTITNARMVIGLYSSAVPKFLQTATNYAHRAEIKLDQNADSRFHCVVANGTASSSGTATGVIASDTVYDIEIRVSASRIVTFYVNSTLVFTSTSAIAASKNLVPLIGLQSEGAKRSMKVYHVIASRNI